MNQPVTSPATRPPLRLSVLDQSIAVAGREHGQSIRETIDLARHCEALGYHRFWVSEHHNHPSIVGTAPEVLMAAIATATTRIRVGSAGIMLPHYATLKVAEQFRVLDAIAPGRIDLGVGRAPGSDGHTAMALNPMAMQEGADRFPQQVRDLIAWTSGAPLAEGHRFASIRALPAGDTSPEVWILGSSNYGAQVAAHFGLPYCFAHFIADGQGAEPAIEIYKLSYTPSERHPAPVAALCVWALAADTQAEAERLFMSRARWRIARDRGQLLALEPPEVAAAHAYSAAERLRLEHLRANTLVGTGAQVASGLRDLAQRLELADLAVLTWAHDPAARRRSYELLAGEFGMVG